MRRGLEGERRGLGIVRIRKKTDRTNVRQWRQLQDVLDY